jgi:hypothetical protein
MQPRAAFLTVALLLGTCSATAQEASVFVEAFHCVGGRFGLALPSDFRTLKKLSKVLREEVGDVEQWEGYTATRKTLHFDGLALGVVEFSNDPARFMVTSAVLTSPSWNRLSPFKLRRPVPEAVSLLGEYANSDPGLRRTYGGESDSVKIQSSGGIVTGVTYECYSG